MASSRRSTGWIWLAVYLALLAGIAAGTVFAHNKLIVELSSPEERASWMTWRAEADKQADTHSPVPRVSEPPMLEMLRDHFPLILAFTLLIPGVLLGFLMLALRGVIQQSAEPRSSTDCADFTDEKKDLKSEISDHKSEISDS